MATLKYCPKCLSEQECQKKGTNADGEQLWYCKKCKTRFAESKSKKIGTKATKTAKTTKSKTAKTVRSVKEDVTTEIIVNNNTVKTVRGKRLTTDQAFEMVSSYFKEIAKDKATVDDQNGKRTIKFKVSAGGKG